MTEEKKKAIRDRWDRLFESEKLKHEPYPEDTPIMMGSSACISVYNGIEIIAEAYGVEVEEVTDDLGDAYKQFTINEVRVHQWVKLGKHKLENGEWKSDDEI